MRILLIITINNGITTFVIILLNMRLKKLKHGLMNKIIIMESITKKKLIIKSDNNKFLY